MIVATEAFQQAVAALNARDFARAKRSFEAVLGQQPTHVPALNLLAIVLMTLGDFENAERHIAKAIALDPSSDASYYNHGLIFKRLSKPDLARRQFDRALELNPCNSETWNNRGTVFNDLKDYERAIADFDQAISLNERYAEAYCNKGKSLFELGRSAQSLTAFEKAMEINPRLAHAMVGRGNVMTSLRSYHDACLSYQAALTASPSFADAWLGMGNARAGLAQYDAALAAYKHALHLQPGSAESWLGIGNIRLALKQYEEAATAYERALQLQPTLFDAEWARLWCRLHLCDWSDLVTRQGRITSAVVEHGCCIGPFAFMTLSTSPADQAKCASLWTKRHFPLSNRPLWAGEVYQHDRLRLAYVSADFHAHATSNLLVGLMECHDKSKFDVTAISIGRTDDSEPSKRLRAAAEKFVDASQWSEDAISAHVRENEIDVLIDLKGFTQGSRTGIFARRPAPIQVSYLGYPGTMGADYIDYLIADRILVPESHKIHYREKIVYLPDSYQINDDKRPRPGNMLARAECGLPEAAFVYCCFNGSYKIVPDVFQAWMRVLKQVEGSVLWLLEDDIVVADNLRREAANSGVDVSRLIFAKREPFANHLARHRLADLFLDTLPVNAHTTASDALWMGLPVLTQLGETFIGRVAASLLTAAGLPELICNSREDYEAAAIALGNQRSRTMSLRERLDRSCSTAPLFDTPMSTRHVEYAYQAMYRRLKGGLPPDHLYVPRSQTS